MDVSKDAHFMQCTDVFKNREGSKKNFPTKLQALQAFHYAVEGKQRSSIEFMRGLRIGIEDSLQNLHVQMSVENLLPIYKKQFMRQDGKYVLTPAADLEKAHKAMTDTPECSQPKMDQLHISPRT